MRGFFFGMVLMVAFTLTVLSLRPGGLRRQLTFAARRLRLALALGGVYIGGTTAIRLFATTDFIAEYAPPVLAALLMFVYLFLARETGSAAQAPPPSRVR